jgi:hypothetical protein
MYPISGGRRKASEQSPSKLVAHTFYFKGDTPGFALKLEVFVRKPGALKGWHNNVIVAVHP